MFSKLFPSLMGNKKDSSANDMIKDMEKLSFCDLEAFQNKAVVS